MNSKIKCHIKKGDNVKVIAGDEKGKTGKVLHIVPQTGRAHVEGINLVKKHVGKSEEHPNGGIVEIEGSIAISNLKVAE